MGLFQAEIQRIGIEAILIADGLREGKQRELMPADVVFQILPDGGGRLLQPLSCLRFLMAREHLPIDDVEEQ